MATRMPTKTASRFQAGRGRTPTLITSIGRQRSAARGTKSIAYAPARPRGKFIRPLAPPKVSAPVETVTRERDLEELIEEE